MELYSNYTTDHAFIKHWARERALRPFINKENHIFLASAGLDRHNSKEISWELFFKVFESKQLAMIYQNETQAGEASKYNLMVNRNHQDLAQQVWP